MPFASLELLARPGRGLLSKNGLAAEGQRLRLSDKSWGGLARTGNRAVFNERSRVRQKM